MGSCRHKNIASFRSVLYAQIAACDECFKDSLEFFFLHTDKAQNVAIRKATALGSDPLHDTLHLPIELAVVGVEPGHEKHSSRRVEYERVRPRDVILLDDRRICVRGDCANESELGNFFSSTRPEGESALVRIRGLLVLRIQCVRLRAHVLKEKLGFRLHRHRARLRELGEERVLVANPDEVGDVR